MALAVRLRSAVALIGNFPALAGADLEVEPGETVLVTGPNGAGKTSLLRVCAGLLPVVSGQVEVLGADLRRDRRAVRRRVGMLGHSSFLYEELTVEENARFALKASGASPQAASEALDRLGLGGRLRSARASTLSAGQRRRLSLAVLWARFPELWLLDEPHAGLDEEARCQLDQLVAEARAAGATVLVASHEPERAGALATRQVSVAGGQVQAVAPPPVRPPAELTAKEPSHVA